MSIIYDKPIFTSITTLTDAASMPIPAFTMVWSDTNSSKVENYKVYRHIERKNPTSLANGGPLIDPKNPDNPIYVNTPPVYKLIATLPNTATTFTDPLTDLLVHSDEGIVLDSTVPPAVWRDNYGYGGYVVDEILHANRRLYYKIVAEYNSMVFNNTPFIYTCQQQGVECRSVITQVTNNTLYREGDIVWFNNDIKNRNRTSVDRAYIPTKNRYNNVWVSGSTNIVHVLNGMTGVLVKSFTIYNVNYISGLRVDPVTGNGIVIGNSDQVYCCQIENGLQDVVPKVQTYAPYAQNGNNGLVLATTANGTKYAYIVANSDVVSICDYSGQNSYATALIPRTDLGCSNTTPAVDNNNQLQNVLGITNGPDQAVWVNGHVPIDYTSTNTYTAGGTSTTRDWIANCPGGNLANGPAWWLGPERGYYCNAEHYVTTTIDTRTQVTVTVTTSFLQDIGYVYGVANGKNYKATNGNLNYDNDPSTYHPFTTSGSRTGWVGISQNANINTGRPYISQLAPSPDPTTSPNPGLSQKGLTTDIPAGDLSASSYNIFQVNQSENRVHKLVWNGTTLTYPDINVAVEKMDYWNISQPVHAIADSQNNIWVIQEHATEQLTKIYRIPHNTTFPSGGDSVWPKIASGTYKKGDYSSITSYQYGNNFNDADIEYALTRTTLVGLATAHTNGMYLSNYGATIDGADLGIKRQVATDWLGTANRHLFAGTRIYPNYTVLNGTYTFAREVGNTPAVPSEYNSDNTGINYAFQQQLTESIPTYIHPDVTYPSVTLKVSTVSSLPLLNDDMFWNDQHIDNSLHTSSSGYDNYMVKLSATILNQGSFYFNGYDWHFADKLKDIGSTYNNPDIITTDPTTNTYDYEYHDPSLNGKVLHRRSGAPAETTGKYTPFVVINTNTNCYYLSGDTIQYSGSSNCVDVTVWERWPTASFYTTPFDTSGIRQTYLTSWNLSPDEYVWPVGNNGFDINDENSIVSGYDPLSAQFTDTSITRTWPISEWYWDFGDKPTYKGFPLVNNFPLYLTYPHITSVTMYNSLPASVQDDCTTEHPNMTAHLYKGPGIYYATLYVRASNTRTDSWNISSGVTNAAQMNSTFVIAATRQINVLEVGASVSFELSGFTQNKKARTVSATYSDDYDPLSNYYNDATYAAPTVNSPYGIISGYAPYLDVSFEGTLTARSLPMSAAYFDFGDPYLNHIKADEVTLYAAPTAGWPNWNTSKYNFTGHHTYVMPGFYNVTMYPIASSEYSSHIGFEKQMHIYLKEIEPIASVLVSAHNYNSSNICSACISGGFDPLYLVFDTWEPTFIYRIPLQSGCWKIGELVHITGLEYSSTSGTNPSDAKIRSGYTRLKTVDDVGTLGVDTVTWITPPIAPENTDDYLLFPATMCKASTSPVTMTFNPSATIAGSFKICSIEWDFGDNTPILTISRWLSSEYVNYITTNAFPDSSDPRNVIVSHVYNRTMASQPVTYTATMSAYACNTNTVGIASVVIGPIALQSVENNDEDVHLLENRMYHKNNDLLLVFEGNKTLSNYTVLLSSTGT